MHEIHPRVFRDLRARALEVRRIVVDREDRRIGEITGKRGGGRAATKLDDRTRIDRAQVSEDLGICALAESPRHVEGRDSGHVPGMA